MGAVTTTATLVILAMAFGQYGCRHPFNFNSCDNISKLTCTNNLYAMAQKMDSASFDVDEACTVLDRFFTCMGSCLKSMTQGPGERALIRSLEYVCDPSIREEVRAAFTAECFREKSLLLLLGQKAHTCASSAKRIFEAKAISGSISMTEGSPVCPMINYMTFCFTEELRNMCGETVSPVFSSMFQTAIGEVLGESTVKSCTNQHSIVRRAVSTFFEQIRK